MPTWIVGTPGEWDHQIIRARSYEAAIGFRAEECEDDDDGGRQAGEPCDCCACTEKAGYEAIRVASWDGKPESEITAGDWVGEGFEASCGRCGYECSHDCGGQSILGEAVCEDCLTLADWDIIDPETAAEKRAEAKAFPAPPSSLTGSTETGR